MSVTNQHSKELKYKPTLSWQMIETFGLNISLTISFLCLIIVLPINEFWLIDKWDHVFNSEGCQKIYPMHTVLLANLFDTKINYLYFIREKVSFLYFFSRCDKTLRWHLLELFRQKFSLKLLFFSQSL